ncbi:TMEM165/GDT1 family protein [Sphingomonas sp. PAMC 26605]|uniref:TMEM165/GDT1 family protein n=1 Tax=Sphingomonas sp. PAMC 26605 TaxID=1112214 RepID=UPI0002E7898A|nr:TMEM165/GDT1 family protein [Sphingomonas sp. PAMC 26605]
MDALMAALVAALFTQASDRTPWTAALLGDRYASKAAVIAATTLAIALGNALGVVGGVIVAPLLSPNARDLLLAFALLSAGASGCWPPKPPKLRDWRLGTFGTSLVAVGLLGFGDRTQFITAALAARSTTPALAAVGATLGAMVVLVPAILLGTRGLRKLPTAALRLGASVGLLIFGAIQGLGALRLI